MGPLLDVLYVDSILPDNVLPTTPRTVLELRIELGDPASTPLVSERPGAVFAENNLCGGPAWFAGGKFGAHIDGPYPQAIEYEPATGRFHAVVGGRFARDTQAVVGRVIRPLLQSFMLPFHRLRSLHGALVARDGRGVFLAGGAGAGKTTTALAFARDGWALLADDGPLFALDGHGAVGLSSLDYLHVSPTTLALFPDLQAGVVGGRDHRGKYAVARSASDIETLRSPVVVDTYVVLRRGQVGGPRLYPLRRAEVFRQLVAEGMTVFRSRAFRDADFAAYTRWSLRLLASFSERAEPVVVEFGDDDLDRIPSFVADHR